MRAQPSTLTPGLSRGSPTALPLLVAVAALGATGMNIILPSLPTLPMELGGDYRRVQSVLTFFLVGAALAQLTMGPLSDVYGRRPLLLGALGLFCAGSAISAVSPSLAILDLGRLLQGFGGAASYVLAQATLVDGTDEASVARKIGYLSAGMAVAIMVAPVVGAVIGGALGWRAIFAATLAAGAVILGVAHPRIAGRPGDPSPGAWRGAARSAASVLASRRFVGHALSAGCVMANYFCLAAFGPLIAISILGMSRIAYGLLFGGLGIFYVGGTLASAGLHRRLGQRMVTVAALLLGAAAGAAGAVLLELGRLQPLSFLAIGLVIALVTGIVLPAASSGALGANHDATGASAGLLNFSIYGVGALVTALVGASLDAAGTAAMAALPMVTVAALLAGLWGLRPERLAGR